MKILHVIPSLGVGGTEKILFELCRRMDPLKFRHSVVSLKSGGAALEALRGIPVPAIVLGCREGFWPGVFEVPRLLSDLGKVIRELSPDIIQTWLTRANVLGRLAARGSGAPVVSALRVMEAEKSYHLWAERLTSGLARVVTVNCPALKDFAVSRIGIPEAKVRLIPNGVEVPPPGGAGPAGRRGGGIRVIGTLGRLHRQKGMDIFLRAAGTVLGEFPDARFVLAGEGPERGNLEALARELGLSGSVEFPGLEDSSRFFSRIDCFVLASRWEGMPNVLLEAMARQVPVAATAVGGAADLISGKDVGLLSPPEDPGALARSVARLMRDPDGAAGMALAARDRVRERFSMERMVRSYEELYASLRPES